MPSLDKRDLGEVALSLLGIFFSVRAFSHIASFTKSALLEGNLYFAATYILPITIYLVSGVSLVFFRRTLSGFLFDQVKEPSEEPVGPLHDFIVSLLGIWLISSALIEAIAVESNLLAYASLGLADQLFESGPARSLVTREAWLSRIPYVAELLLGVVLFVSSGRIVELWERMRTVGRLR